MQVHIWNKTGVTRPHRAGTAEPARAAGLAGTAGPTGAAGPAGTARLAGAVGPAPHHDSSPSDHHFHKHTLDG
jgi:hypothetical protein